MRAASCSDFASGGCGMCVHSMNEIEGICDNMCSFHIFHMRSYCACLQPQSSSGFAQKPQATWLQLSRQWGTTCRAGEHLGVGGG